MQVSSPKGEAGNCLPRKGEAMTYVRMIKDSRGDIVDVEHYCSAGCYADATGQALRGLEA